MNNIIIISWPTVLKNELIIVNQLFGAGLKQFHIRKPDFTIQDMRNYINDISEDYRKYLVLHSHFQLAKEMDLLGIQIGAKRLEKAKKYINTFDYFGYSAHSLLEIEENGEKYSHYFLSPVFDSISKINYKSKFSPTELKVFLKNNRNIIALGGIDSDNAEQCFALGFSSVAVLGNIWLADNSVNAFQKMLHAINR